MRNFLNWAAPAPATRASEKEAAPQAPKQGEPGGGGNTDITWHSVVTDTYGLLWKLIIRPPRCEYRVADLGPDRFRLGTQTYERQDLQLTNERGQRLECSHYRPCDPALDRGERKLPCVVYLHGNCSSRQEAGDCMQVLLPRGLTVFAFDFAGSGLSEGQYISLGHYEEKDLKAVVRHLRTLPYVSSIGLWGRSMGAATAILRAAEDWCLGAMVLDSPFSSLPLVAQELVNSQVVKVPDFLLNMALQMVREEILSRAKFDIQELIPLRSAARARSPALFAVAEDDDFVLPHHTRDLHRVWGGNERKLATFTGGHNGARPRPFLEEAATFLRDRLCLASRPLNPPAALATATEERQRALRLDGGDSDEEDRVLYVVPPPREEPPPPPPPPPPQPREQAVSSTNRPGGRPNVRNEAVAAQLMGMGFSQDMVEEASKRTSTMEAALEWILSHSQQTMRETVQGLGRIELRAPSRSADALSVDDRPGPARAVATTTAGAGGGARAGGFVFDSVAAGRVRQLMELGVSRSAALEAVQRSSTVEGAVEWLAAHGHM